MSANDGHDQFLSEVFPAELEEINVRRRRLQLPETGPADGTTSTKRQLVGLALSGGGIRSAVFCLGVIQALARHGLLRSVDYLSTVSGGGFVGSCISSLLNDKDVGPEQDRFPLRYDVGAREPLAVGQLRQAARYLAPGGLLHKLRIPALVLRGVLSNLLIFLLLILSLVFVTEFVYEVGSSIRLPFGELVLSAIVMFVALVILSPVLMRLLRHQHSWAGRNFEEMTFTVVLVIFLSTVLFVFVSMVVDRWLGDSWVDAKNAITSDLLRPFEPRDSLKWLFIFAMLALFMFAGRASSQVARIPGKILLVILGLLGPVFLFVVFIGLLPLQVDSPFVGVRTLFTLDSSYANDLGDMDRVSSDLRDEFRDNQVRLAKTAQVITLEDDLRWLIHDGERGYALMHGPGGVRVNVDHLYALNRGIVSPELAATLAKKGHRLSADARAVTETDTNRSRILGSHVYSIEHDPVSSEWSVAQNISGPTQREVLQRINYTIQLGDGSGSVLLNDGVALSDDDLRQAIRFVEEANPHDVVLLVDNSALPFVDAGKFAHAFRRNLKQALGSLRSSVRMAVFWFDEDVHEALELKSLTPDAAQTVLHNLFEGRAGDSSRLNFQGTHSNVPAALERAIRELREKSPDRVRKSIVLVGDGTIDVPGDRGNMELQNWIEGGFTQDARAAGIRLYGIALSENARFDLFAAMARGTGGAFYPVFESQTDEGFEELFEAMEKIREAAGSHLISPFDQVQVTDVRRGTVYTLSRNKGGLQIRAALNEPELAAADLAQSTGPWREVFRDNGIELGEAATIAEIGNQRWEVRDPYEYTISARGRRMMVTPGVGDENDGFSGLLRGGIPDSVWDGRTDWVLLGIFVLLLIYWLSVDINLIAANSFYRDRLSKAFLFRAGNSGSVEHRDKQLLSELNGEGSAAPYHLINVALNLQGSRDPDLRGRVCDFFVFTKHFIGSERTTFAKTKEIERYDSNLDLGTAMAISGAAAAPNAGATTLKSLVFILTLLNARLGYWLPNPRVAGSTSWLGRLALRRGPGPKYLLKESLGRLNDEGTYLNVSDGGHIENLGIFELLRRRCKFIIAVDSERDRELQFRGLVKLMIYARVDLGVSIDIDLDPIRKDAQGLSEKSSALGTIRYADGETGYLLYIKPSIKGGEYEYVRLYHSDNPDFPHESTAEQFFSEARFEAYRGLGYQIGDQLFSDDDALGELAALKQRGADDRKT